MSKKKRAKEKQSRSSTTRKVDDRTLNRAASWAQIWGLPLAIITLALTILGIYIAQLSFNQNGSIPPPEVTNILFETQRADSTATAAGILTLQAALEGTNDISSNAIRTVLANEASIAQTTSEAREIQEQYFQSTLASWVATQTAIASLQKTNPSSTRALPPPNNPSVPNNIPASPTTIPPSTTPTNVPPSYTPLPPTDPPPATATNPPVFSFTWDTQITCAYIQNRVNNLNSVDVIVTGFISVKPDNGDEKTISAVPPPYQNCPPGYWCGPIEDINNHFTNFQGVIWGTTWVHYQGEEVAKNSFGPTTLSCSP